MVALMREHETATAVPRRSRRLHTRESSWQIPIVNRNRRIVGWTHDTPETIGASLRHAEAERLVGGAVTATYVQISDRVAAGRAGAPLGWNGPWRCLAIIAVDDADGGVREHVPLLDVDL